MRFLSLSLTIVPNECHMIDWFYSFSLIQFASILTILGRDQGEICLFSDEPFYYVKENQKQIILLTNRLSSTREWFTEEIMEWK